MKNELQIKLLGLHVRKLRHEKGFSQIELADEADVARSTIQRLEKAEINPTADLLFSIAEALNIEPKDLLDFQGSVK